MAASTGQPIAIGERRCLILVEGNDDKEFFETLTQNLNLHGSVQVAQYRGKDNLSNVLAAYVIEAGFPNVRVLCVIRDADSSAQSAFQSVCAVLQQNNLVVPTAPMQLTAGTPHTSVIILPGNNRQGMLEDLCLEVVADDPAMPCIDQFFECVNGNNIPIPSNLLSKARVQAFLALNPKAGLRLGLAGRQGVWPWESDVFKPLKDHLQELAAAATTGD